MLQPAAVCHTTNHCHRSSTAGFLLAGFAPRGPPVTLLPLQSRHGEEWGWAVDQGVLPPAWTLQEGHDAPSSITPIRLHCSVQSCTINTSLIISRSALKQQQCHTGVLTDRRRKAVPILPSSLLMVRMEPQQICHKTIIKGSKISAALQHHRKQEEHEIALIKVLENASFFSP